MRALTRLAMAATAWVMTLAAAPPQPPVSFTMTLQRSGPKLILTSKLHNNRATPVCVERLALEPREVKLLRGGRAIPLKHDYDWSGRPPPGCLVLAPGAETAASYDLAPRYRRPPRPGDLVCDQENWGEIVRINGFDDMADPVKTLKRCVAVK